MGFAKAYINATNLVTIGNSSYFWSRNCNGLFVIDSESGVCAPIFQYKDNDVQEEHLIYTKCIFVNDKIVAAPYYSHKILLYYPEEEKAEFIPLKSAGYFNDMIVWGGWIYFYGVNSIVKMNILNNEVEYISPISNMQANVVCHVEDRVYIPSDRGNEIICVNLNNDSSESIKIGKDRMVFNNIVKCGDELVLSGDRESIILWNTNSGECKSVKIPSAFYKRYGAVDSTAFCRSSAEDEKVIFSPAKLNYAMLYNCSTGEWNKIFKMEENERCASYISDGILRCFICESLIPRYEPSRVLRLDDEYRVYDMDAFVLDENADMQIGMNESRVNTLERFIGNIIR